MNAATQPDTSTQVVIIGGGGFARETLDVIDAHNAARPSEVIVVVGIVDGGLDSADRELLEARGATILGSDDDWLREGDHEVPYLLAIGDPALKKRIDGRYRAAGIPTHPGVTHPAAGLGTVGAIGEGTIICSGVEVSTNVSTGRHVHLNPNATIGHDARLADFVSINPAAVISGHVIVQAGVLIGAGAVILERRTVGEWSTVGAAACVVDDVLPRRTVKGVPAQ